MGIEIERKYLVKDSSFKGMAVSKHNMIQGYLSRDPERTVRIRLKDNTAFITVKGITKGESRLEFEYEIPYEDALELIKLCESPVIDKTRYNVPYGNFIWEVDEFHGQLEGLTLAEIELPSTDTEFLIPSFIGKDVTGDPTYYNSNLHALSISNLHE